MKDILLSDNGEVLFLNGDVLVGDSDTQNQKYILLFSPGQSKQNPTIGCSFASTKLGKLDDKMTTLINSQMFEDGYYVRKLTFDLQGNLQIIASR